MQKIYLKLPKHGVRHAYEFSGWIQICPAAIIGHRAAQLLHDVPSPHYPLLAGREGFK